MRKLRGRAELGIAVAALGSALLWTACSVEAQKPAGVRVISLGNVVHLKTRIASGPLDAPEKSVLMESEGAPDEPPEGPTGFAVLPDGGFAVTDPLQKRVVIVDKAGNFRAEWKIGYPADSLSLGANGLIRARNAATGDEELFDGEGHLKGKFEGHAETPGDARLLGPNRGVITSSQVTGASRPDLQVIFQQPGLRLISLQPLAIDREGNQYVSLEVSAGGDAIEVSKIVRKYAKGNALVAEVDNLPLDYYVQPVDELRVSKGIVYQLMPLRSEVRINSWDTN